MENTMIIKTLCCSSCGNAETDVVQEKTIYNFKGETFEIEETKRICTKCQEDVYDEILDNKTLQYLTNLYAERIGVPLDTIKEIRAQYNLSMETFSKLLGVSKSTIVRYESGKYIPDSAHMILLKNLKEHPETLLDFYKLNGHRLNERESKKVKSYLEGIAKFHMEDELIKLTTNNYKQYEKSIDSGYVEFSIEKALNMIVFFAENGVQKTKLMKLLFYSDFLTFKRNVISISGMPYARLPHGPVPLDHEVLLTTAQRNDYIDIEESEQNGYTTITITSADQFNDSLFTQDELDVMSEVKDYFNSFGSVKISDFSHEEEGWKQTPNQEIISYDFSENLQLD